MNQLFGLQHRRGQYRSMAGHEDLASQDIASEVQIWRTPDSDSSDSIILPMLVWYGITIKMTLTYIFHSGLVLETDSAILVCIHKRN